MIFLTGDGNTAAFHPEGHPLHHGEGRVGVVVGRDDHESVVDSDPDQDEGEDLRQGRERDLCQEGSKRKERRERTKREEKALTTIIVGLVADEKSNIKKSGRK